MWASRPTSEQPLDDHGGGEEIELAVERWLPVQRRHGPEALGRLDQPTRDLG
jgi:hypothetical protein